MDKIIDYILNKKNCKFEDLQFFSAKYYEAKNLLLVVFVSKQYETYSQEKVDLLRQIVCEYTDNKFDVEVKVKNVFISNDLLFEMLKKHISSNPIYQAIFDIEKSDCKLENDNLYITLFVDINSFEDEREKFEEEIEKLYSNYSLKIHFDYKNISKNFQEELEIRKQIISDDGMVEDDDETSISYVKNYLGKMDDISSALMPYQVKSGDQNVYIAGEISAVSEYTRVKKTDEAEKEVKYYKFNISCPESSLEAVCFLKNASDLTNLENGQKIVILGDVEQFKESLSVKVKALSLCKFEFKEKKQKTVSKYYKFVKPEPYIQSHQISFLDTDTQIKSNYLKNNTFVVFDLETTGFNPATCKIIEIGAVKVVNGIITEQFSTFVNPQMHIPEEATAVNNITDDMVKDAPVFKQVFPDFYKFIEGSILVAHNISFDYPFLSYHAKPLGYTISNRQQDTMILARKHLYQLKHFKLSNICDFLGVSLIGAHRAVNDTIATAKCFVKLIENYDNSDLE